MSKKNISKCKIKTSIGGSALIEGVMMKSPQKCAMSVRIPDDTIDTEYIEAPSLIKKHKWLNIPIIRGCINMVEQMIFSTKCLYKSAEKSGLALEEEVEEPSKFEKWIDKVFGDKLFGFIMSIGMVLGVALSVVLFIYLPMIVVKGIETATISFFNFELGMFKNVIEGVIKLA
ncbi:MAG: DUF1385 domain-containing protein, partial [Oscillospiraceae bacterium]